MARKNARWSAFSHADGKRNDRVTHCCASRPKWRAGPPPPSYQATPECRIAGHHAQFARMSAQMVGSEVTVTTAECRHHGAVSHQRIMNKCANGLPTRPMRVSSEYRVTGESLRRRRGTAEE